MKPLYKGVWAENLVRGQDLPIVRGKLGEKTANLHLDFDAFEDSLDGWHSPKIMSEAYLECKDLETSLLDRALIDVDSYLFFVCTMVNDKVRELLLPQNPIKFRDTEENLSDMIGRAGCAEQAALGQYLLQQVLEKEYSSVFMSGTEYRPKGERYAHSLLVLNWKNKTHLFDISRPISLDVPTVLATDIPFTYELFKDKDNMLVGATEVLHGGRLCFGIGDPVSYK